MASGSTITMSGNTVTTPVAATRIRKKGNDFLIRYQRLCRVMFWITNRLKPVSYTHLTLPTIYSV